MLYLWLCITLPALFATWIAWAIIRSLYLHPLRRVPGPRLAAVTRLYSFYHNVIRPWLFGERVAQLHQKYGKVNRIGA